MTLFNRDRGVQLQARLRRLEADHHRAAAASDGIGLERNRHETWALMQEAGRQLQRRHEATQPLLSTARSLPSHQVTSRTRDLEPLAAALLGAAKLSLTYETAAKNWQRAAVAGYMVGFAVTTLGGGGPDPDTAMPRQVAAFLNRIPDLAAYAAHRAGLPQLAVMILEAVTSLVLDDRMMSRSLEAYAEHSSTQPDLERLLGRLRHLAVGSSASAA